MGKLMDFLSLQNIKAVAGEFLATAIFVFIGLASCLNWTHTIDHDQLIRIGLTFGFGLTGVIYAFGPISGGHVNPAVTIGAIIAGRIDGLLGALYVLAQVLGATCGAGMLYVLQAEHYTGERAPQFGLTKVNPDLTVEQGLFTEFALTFIFVLTILLITDQAWTNFSHGSIAIGIGLSLMAMEFGFVASTGGSLNPARSIGPALIVNHFDQLWVYIVGPIFGGVLGSITYRVFTYEYPNQSTTEGGAQTTSQSDVNGNKGNDPVFVSSDINTTSSFDEIVVPEDAKR